MPKLLFLSGSARKGSLNQKLADAASKVAVEKGADVTLINLADFDMPIYNGDYESEHGLPENAIKLKGMFADHDGFFMASPEYNSALSPLLKNTIDWISRPHVENEGKLIAFKGKVAALGAVSPGALGGLRGLVSLRSILGNIGVFVTPTQIAVGQGGEAFSDDNALVKDNQAAMLDNVITEFVETSGKL